MKILFINTNQIVQKLIEVTAQKANVELVSINNIKQATDIEQYDYIIIDDDCYNTDKDAFDVLIAGRRACLIYSKSDEMPTGFSEYVKKPFIPTHILNIMIEEISKLQTKESFTQDSATGSDLDSTDLAQSTEKDSEETLAQVSEDTLLDDLDLGEIEEVDEQEDVLEQDLDKELNDSDDSNQEDLEDLLDKAKALTETLDSQQLEQANESEQSDSNTSTPQVLDTEQINEVSDLLHEIETSSPKSTKKETLEQEIGMQEISQTDLEQDLAQDTANDLAIDDFSLDTLDEGSQDLDNSILDADKVLDSKLSDDELFDSIDRPDPKDDLSQQKDEQLQDFQTLNESQILQALGETPKTTNPKTLDSKSEALASALSQSIEQSLTNLQNSEIKTLLDGMEVTISINFKDKSNA